MTEPSTPDAPSADSSSLGQARTGAARPDPAPTDAPSADGPARTVRLATMTAREYEEWVGGGSAVAILPTGAFEQHGPHLPLGTDAILSTAVEIGRAHV